MVVEIKTYKNAANIQRLLDWQLRHVKDVSAVEFDIARFLRLTEDQRIKVHWERMEK